MKQSRNSLYSSADEFNLNLAQLNRGKKELLQLRAALYWFSAAAAAYFIFTIHNYII